MPVKIKDITGRRRIIDITGRRFGRLVVLNLASERYSKRVVWKCLCDCGKITFKTGHNLQRRQAKSCGCLHKEIARIRGLLNYGKNKDITGQRFGMLIALESTSKTLGHSYVWKCRCDCGKIAYISINNLHSGNTTSCGCLRIAGRFFNRVKINRKEIPLELIKCIVAYYELRKAIKQAS